MPPRAMNRTTLKRAQTRSPSENVVARPVDSIRDFGNYYSLTNRPGPRRPMRQLRYTPRTWRGAREAAAARPVPGLPSLRCWRSPPPRAAPPRRRHSRPPPPQPALARSRRSSWTATTTSFPRRRTRWGIPTRRWTGWVIGASRDGGVARARRRVAGHAHEDRSGQLEGTDAPFPTRSRATASRRRSPGEYAAQSLEVSPTWTGWQSMLASTFAAAGRDGVRNVPRR